MKIVGHSIKVTKVVTVYACAFLLMFAPIQNAVAKDLVKDSPFVPQGFNTRKKIKKKKPPVRVSNNVSNIEFQGFYSVNGKYFFNIRNKKDRKSEWVSLNESGAGFYVERFDPATTSVTIRIDGKSEQIALKSASGRSIPVKTAVASNQQKPRPAIASRRNPITTGPGARGRQSPVVRRRVIIPARNNPAQVNKQPGQQDNKPNERNIRSAREVEELFKNLQTPGNIPTQ